MSQMYLDTCPRVELLNAILVKKGEIQLTNNSLITYEDVNEFVSACIDDLEYEKLYTLIKNNRSSKIIEYLIDGIDHRTFISQDINRKASEYLIDFLEDSTVNKKIEREYSRFNDKLSEAFSIAKRLHDRSKYDHTCIFDGIETKLRLMPQLFMQAAPFGRYGYFNENNNTITILFGSTKVIDCETQRFNKWFQFGVWHLMTKCILHNTMISKIPKEFPLSLKNCKCLHMNNKVHQNFQQYTSDLLINAVKMLAEQEVVSDSVIIPLSKEEGLKEPYSKGLYHIEWFVSELKGKKITSSGMNHMLSKWLDYLKTSTPPPVFVGPLEACFYLHWLKEIRMIFSSSISTGQQEKITLVYEKILNTKLKRYELEEKTFYKFSDYNNFIFMTYKDKIWENKLYQYLNLESNEYISEDSNYQFVLRNPDNSNLFTRVCVTLDEMEILRINRQGGNHDWFAINLDQKLGGEIQYMDGKCVFTVNRRGEYIA